MNHRARREALGLSSRQRLSRRDRVADRDGRLCHYCRRPFGSLYAVTLDHYIPFALAPDNDPANLVLACESCNQAKADRLPLTLAWLLLARSGGRCVPPLAPFTADWPVFRAAFMTAAPARIGRPVTTGRGRAVEVVFSLTVNAFTPRGAGVRPGGGSADRRAVRAVVPIDRKGRVVTWKNGKGLNRVTARVTANVTPRPVPDSDPIPAAWADPIGADWIGRSTPTGSAVNTDPRPVNTPPAMGRSRRGHLTGPNAWRPDSRQAVNTTVVPVNPRRMTVNTTLGVAA